MHTIQIAGRVGEPEKGLIIGNGDLSISVYQSEDMVIWRFGKNDVWDRRLDLSDCPEAAHIDEMIRGVKEEGWTSQGYVDGAATASGKVADPKRMNELCNGWPAYAHRPFPCPKPVGELALHLPIDQRELLIKQWIDIEDDVLHIRLDWVSGLSIQATCFVAPDPNALVVKWKVENWTEETATPSRPPVWFTLYRWPDPHIREFAAKLMVRSGYAHNFRTCAESEKSTPLPPPTVDEQLGRLIIEQHFYPDLEFTDGFRYFMVPYTEDLEITKCSTYDSGWAALFIQSKKVVLEGSLAVVVPTDTDDGGALAEFTRVNKGISKNFQGVVKEWERLNGRSARDFWARSSVRIDDSLMENLWYETLHMRRSTYRAGVIAPGLALPCTLPDYTLWHGDYHLNYNYQQPFWADYGANHPEIADSFFPGMQHMVEIGRKLAAKYWDCRGTFIQVTGYPFPVEDDPYGSGPLCRMAYMTGWVSNHYWRKYQYTLDIDWLRDEGYPVMRDCALFYTDFVDKQDDGKYHAFSLQGESLFSDNEELFTDQPQVIRHIRYCFQSAIEASGILDVDADLREEWRERLENLYEVDNLDELGFSEEERRRYHINPPEFQGMDIGYTFPRPGDPVKFLRREPGGTWGEIGSAAYPWRVMTYLRNRAYVADRDYDGFRDLIYRGRVENGSVPAMSQQTHGYIGLYGESHGVIAPLQEMMLQSWDGAIRVFPDWPMRIAAKFESFRAEGAFLVTAAWSNGEVTSLSITSECGGDCRLEGPWGTQISVTLDDGSSIDATEESNGIYSFSTVPGGTYVIAPA